MTDEPPSPGTKLPGANPEDERAVLDDARTEETASLPPSGQPMVISSAGHFDPTEEMPPLGAETRTERSPLPPFRGATLLVDAATMQSAVERSETAFALGAAHQAGEPSGVGEGQADALLAPRSEHSEATVMLDPEMQDRLMALRAQQDQALKAKVAGKVVVMFTDLVGSTAYYEKYGDLAGRQKMLTHNALLFPIIRGRNGTIIKTIGDAIMCCFDEVESALTAAIEMQQALAAFNESCTEVDEEIHIRIGINAGSAIAEDGDLHGDAVNVAARVEAKADSDEILVSEEVRSAAPSHPFTLKGRVHFKGKAERVSVYALKWRDRRPLSRPVGRGLLAKRYRLGKQLGRGPVGVVFAAEDLTLEVPVAVKVLHDYIAADSESVEAFTKRFATMASLRHPGIVRLVDSASRDSDDVYYVMDRVRGRPLHEWIKSHGPSAPGWAAGFVVELGRAVAYAHDQGVVHANIKPENVFVVEERPLLSDFGIAAVHQVQGTRAGASVASPAFLAPEQVMGSPPVPQTDVYGLGALLYYLLAGQPPYDSAGTLKAMRAVVSGLYTRLPKVRPGLPRGLVRVCERAMATKVEDRPESVAAFLTELEVFVTPRRRDSEEISNVSKAGRRAEAKRDGAADISSGAQVQLLRRALIGVSVAAGVLLMAMAIAVVVLLEKRSEGAITVVKEIVPVPTAASSSPSSSASAAEVPTPVKRPRNTGRAKAEVSGILDIRSTPAADIYLDAEHMGRTPPRGSVQLAVEPGVHTLRLVHRNREPHMQKVEIIAGEETRVRVKLKPLR